MTDGPLIRTFTDFRFPFSFNFARDRSTVQVPSGQFTVTTTTLRRTRLSFFLTWKLGLWADWPSTWGAIVQA